MDSCVPLPNLEVYADCFPPLGTVERSTDWGRELLIGVAFGKEQDFYRSITTFKRSLILLPPTEIERRHQLQYEIIVCYYLGKRYCEAIDYFENSELVTAKADFPGYSSLLPLLHDAYLKVDQPERAQTILNLTRQQDEELAYSMELSAAIRYGDLSTADELTEGAPADHPVRNFINCYCSRKKSVRQAQVLNAVIPGMGYAYVGQRQSGVTSFLLNTLFIWGSYRFFDEGYTAAGIVTASFEFGWYFGGINGAGIEANEYNERLYEGLGRHALDQKRLYPIQLFQCVF